MIRSGQIKSDPASYNVTHSSSESDSARLEKRITPPRYLFGLSNSANVYQHVLCQIIELRSAYGVYSGEEENRVDDIIHPGEGEFRVVNVILHLLGQQENGEGTLHPIIDLPT